MGQPYSKYTTYSATHPPIQVLKQHQTCLLNFHTKVSKPRRKATQRILRPGGGPPGFGCALAKGLIWRPTSIGKTELENPKLRTTRKGFHLRPAADTLLKFRPASKPANPMPVELVRSHRHLQTKDKGSTVRRQAEPKGEETCTNGSLFSLQNGNFGQKLCALDATGQRPGAGPKPPPKPAGAASANSVLKCHALQFYRL